MDDVDDVEVDGVLSVNLGNSVIAMLITVIVAEIAMGRC